MMHILGMPCPKCGGKTSIIDVRPGPNKNIIRRRVGCDACDIRFTTYEMYGDYFNKSEAVVKNFRKVTDLANELCPS
jgi:transcriptional regulator NrdR family protein